MRHLDLFSGIGGFALAARWMDWQTIGFCEKDTFCHAILKKHWPDVPIIDDIHNLDGSKYGTVDIITGGFPCQPYSVAGKRLGNDDDRALWPQMLRVIQEAKPRWIVGENVAGIVNMALDGVLADLENQGYECQSFIIPACAKNAPHRRDRVWIVAHSRCQYGARGSELGESQKQIRQWDAFESERPTKCHSERIVANANSERHTGNGFGRTYLQGQHRLHDRKRWYERPCWQEHWLEAATKFCVVDDGLPNGLARPRGWRNAALKATGNAIVPQVVYEIFKAIQTIENL